MDKLGYTTKPVVHNDICLYKFQREQLNQIDVSSEIPHQHHLVGNIRKEFFIPNVEYLSKLITPVVQYADENVFHEHGLVTKMMSTEKINPPILCDAWINRQKKYEFNPMHTHNGVYSFVLFYDIPYTREEEKKSSPYSVDDDKNKSGCFAYIDKKGKVQTIKCDNSWNGTLLVFPSQTIHTVYPFYSTDEERITIAGNYRYPQ
jgi:hypothetical protein